MPTSQPEALLDEEHYRRAVLIGSSAFLHFGTEQGGIIFPYIHYPFPFEIVFCVSFSQLHSVSIRSIADDLCKDGAQFLLTALWSVDGCVPVHMAASCSTTRARLRFRDQRRLRTGSSLLLLHSNAVSVLVLFVFHHFSAPRCEPAVIGSCFKKSRPAMWWGNALGEKLAALACAGHKSWRRRRRARRSPWRPSWPTSSTMLRPWRLRGRRGRTSMKKSSR